MRNSGIAHIQAITIAIVTLIKPWICTMSQLSCYIVGRNICCSLLSDSIFHWHVHFAFVDFILLYEIHMHQ